MVGCGARLVTTFRFAFQSTPCPRGKVKPILGAAVDSPGARYRKLPDRYRLNHYIEERALLRRQRTPAVLAGTRVSHRRLRGHDVDDLVVVERSPAAA